MCHTVRVAFALLLCCAASPRALAAHTHLPTRSRWRLNLRRSHFGDGPVLRAETFTMHSDTDRGASYTDLTVDASGKRWSSSWSGPANGSPRPVHGMRGAAFSSNAATDTSVMRLADGTTTTCKFSLHDHNRRLVDRCVTRDRAGHQLRQTLVYERVR